MATTQVSTAPANAIASIRADLEKMTEQFRFALPAHIPPDRFIRVVMTAIQNNPKLARCTKQSLFNACMRAAQDGLLPDGREGAIVPYAEDEEGRGSSEHAQWLPMIAGIRKKVRNAGVLTDWNVQVVHDGDEFDYALGDSPFIHHKPAARGGSERPVLFAYSIATFPDGTKSREVMNIDQIKDIQSKSKAKRGPWSDPIFFPEMARKTVARRHSKQLPMSTDLDRLMHRDDDLYDFTDARERAKRDGPRPASIKEAFDSFSADPPPPKQAAIENKQPAPAEMSTTAAGGPVGEVAPEPTGAPGGGETSSPPGSNDAVRAAFDRGAESRKAGHQRRAVPGEYREKDRSAEALAWDRGWNGDAL